MSIFNDIKCEFDVKRKMSPTKTIARIESQKKKINVIKNRHISYLLLLRTSSLERSLAYAKWGSHLGCIGYNTISK